jgi:hypothetical protein
LQHSLSSTYYNVIWGTRCPVLVAAAPEGYELDEHGRCQGDVTSTSDYIGVERVTVPAFPEGVLAREGPHRGDAGGRDRRPYAPASAVWWVYGVGR